MNGMRRWDISILLCYPYLVKSIGFYAAKEHTGEQMGNAETKPEHDVAVITSADNSISANTAEPDPQELKDAAMRLRTHFEAIELAMHHDRSNLIISLYDLLIDDAEFALLLYSKDSVMNAAVCKAVEFRDSPEAWWTATRFLLKYRPELVQVNAV